MDSGTLVEGLRNWAELCLNINIKNTLGLVDAERVVCPLIEDMYIRLKQKSPAIQTRSIEAN